MADNDDPAGVVLLAAIGILFLFLSSGLLTFMGDPRDLLVDRDLSKRAQTVQGIVLRFEDTYHEVNEEPVEAIGFKYMVDGKDYEGQSYTSEYSVLNTLTVGDPVTVEYLPDVPQSGRVKGTSVAQVPWYIFLIVAPFILMGVGMICGSAVYFGQSILGSQKTTEGTFVDASGQAMKEPWHEG